MRHDQRTVRGNAPGVSFYRGDALLLTGVGNLGTALATTLTSFAPSWAQRWRPRRGNCTATRTDKIYSVHELAVACIAKGKAGRKYEFGQKVSVATTSKGGWLLGALCVPGNPYDGHISKAQLAQVDRLYIEKTHLKTIHVDMGYRGHDYDGPVEVLVDRRGRGSIPKRVWRWMKRKRPTECLVDA